MRAIGQKPAIAVLGRREHTSTFIVHRIGNTVTSEMLAIPFRQPADRGLHVGQGVGVGGDIPTPGVPTQVRVY